MSFIESALTPGGTNAAQAQNRSLRGLGNTAGSLAGNLSGLVGNQIDFANRLEPASQKNLLQLMEMLKGDGLKKVAERQKLKTEETYRNQGLRQRQQLAAQGADEATLQSFDLDLGNRIAKAQGDIDMEYGSPEFQTKLIAELQRYISEGAQIDQLPALSSLISLAYGQPGVPVQQGIGDVFGQLGGLFLQANPGMLRL